MLLLFLLLCVYFCNRTQCTHNDKYPGDQPILFSCLLLLDYHSCQNRYSQVVILVTRFWHHVNTNFRVIVGTMIQIVLILCPPYWKRHWISLDGKVFNRRTLYCNTTRYYWVNTDFCLYKPIRITSNKKRY